jgi:hypothetical protein
MNLYESSTMIKYDATIYLFQFIKIETSRHNIIYLKNNEVFYET